MQYERNSTIQKCPECNGSLIPVLQPNGKVMLICQQCINDQNNGILSMKKCENCGLFRYIKVDKHCECNNPKNNNNINVDNKKITKGN